MSFSDEFDDLIIRDVKKEGYTGEEAILKVKEKKRALLRALEQELQESVAEADKDWEEGNTVTLWPRKE